MSAQDGIDRTGYMTLRDGADYAGLGNDRNAGLRLRRKLERVERRRKREIIIREGTGNGARLWVTKPMIRDYLPELFSKRSRIEGMVRRGLDEVKSELQIARKERRALGVRILKVERRVDRAEQCT